MIEYLEKKKIDFNKTSHKIELSQFCRMHAAEKTFVIDEMAQEYGHDVLRLPPYHCEYNPIELMGNYEKLL